MPQKAEPQGVKTHEGYLAQAAAPIIRRAAEEGSVFRVQGLGFRFSTVLGFKLRV